MGPILAVWAVCVVIAWAIGSGKGRGADGLVLGVLLGLLGVIIIAAMKPSVAVQARQAEELEAARAQLRAQGGPPAGLYAPLPDAGQAPTEPSR